MGNYKNLETEFIDRTLHLDIYAILNMTFPENSQQVIKDSIGSLGIWSQAFLAEAFGDFRTSKKLKRLTIKEFTILKSY